MQSDTTIACVIVQGPSRRFILTWKLSAGRIKVVQGGIGATVFLYYRSKIDFCHILPVSREISVIHYRKETILNNIIK